MWPGIAEYWIADLEHDLIEQHQEPVAGRYARLARCRRGETITGGTLGALTLAVADILAEPPAL